MTWQTLRHWQNRSRPNNQRLVFSEQYARAKAKGVLQSTMFQLPLNVTAPKAINPAVLRFSTTINADIKPLIVPVIPTRKAAMSECFFNVKDHVQLVGGEMQYGWIIWEAPKIFLEAEHHAVWRTPKGDLIDITPLRDGEKEIVFLPDNRQTFDFERLKRKANHRFALHSSTAVDQLLMALAERDRQIEAYRSGKEVRIPGSLYDSLQMAISQLGIMVAKAVYRPNDICFCGSKKKYKRCHQPMINAA